MSAEQKSSLGLVFAYLVCLVFTGTLTSLEKVLFSRRGIIYKLFLLYFGTYMILKDCLSHLTIELPVKQACKREICKC